MDLGGDTQSNPLVALSLPLASRNGHGLSIEQRMYIILMYLRTSICTIDEYFRALCNGLPVVSFACALLWFPHPHYIYPGGITEQ